MKEDIMAGELSLELDSRVSALETRILSLGRLGRADGDTNGCTNCNTNGCTNCIAHELVNVLLPGEERMLTGREIVGLLQKARGRK
jgi:hypothetical protein